ncbi:MAG: hypothetical protein ACI9QQ_000073 [Myxococcota bacterium]|jgi:hypothetical protein
MRLLVSTGIVCLLVGFNVGCASLVEITPREMDTVSEARTWSFLRHEPPLAVSDAASAPEFTYRVTSPNHDARSFDAKIASHIERELEQRGFVQVAADADLYVDYQLTLTPLSRWVEVPFAQRFVPSFSTSNSYIIEGTNLQRRDSQELKLEIDFRERRGRIVWRAEGARSIADGGKVYLQDDVAAVLDRLPASSVTLQTR